MSTRLKNLNIFSNVTLNMLSVAEYIAFFKEFLLDKKKFSQNNLYIIS